MIKTNVQRTGDVMNNPNATSEATECLSATALATVLSCVSTPVFLLRPDGVVLQQNAAASDLLACQWLLKRDTRLIGRRSLEADLMADVIRRVAESQHSNVFCLSGRDGTVNLILTIAAVTGADLLTICTADFGSSQVHLKVFLQSAFGFTSQHAKLAVGLMYGLSPAEFASKANVTSSSVREGLEELFARTRTRSRAALMSALWRSAAVATTF